MKKTHAKIFTLTFLTSSICLILCFIYFCIYQKKQYEWEEWFMYQDVFTKVANKHQNADTLFLGDSRLKVIVEPKKNEVNLSLPNIGPIEAYFLLKRYLKNKNKVKQIVLSFAPFHLIQTRFFFNRSISYNFLSKKELDLVYHKSLELTDTHFDSYSYYKTKFLPSTYFTKIKTLIHSPKTQKINSFKSLLVKNNGQTYFGKQQGSSHLCDETTIKNKHYSPTIRYFLKSLIELCKNNNIKIVYYKAPLNNSSCRVLGPKFFKRHSGYLSKLQLKLLPTTNCYSDQYFGDSSHLYLGANLARQELKKQLN